MADAGNQRVVASDEEKPTRRPGPTGGQVRFTESCAIQHLFRVAHRGLGHGLKISDLASLANKLAGFAASSHTASPPIIPSGIPSFVRTRRSPTLAT